MIYDNLKKAYSDGDMKLLRIMGDWIKPVPPLFNSFSEPEFKYVYELIKGSDGWCIDVGANVGEISEIFLKWGHKVLMIEPVEKYYEQLQRLLCYPNAIIYNYACYFQDSIINLFSMPDSGGFETTDVHQLGAYFSWENDEDRRYDSSVEISKVYAKKLQSILDRENIEDILLLKIDVEGGELEVLCGISDKQFDKIEYIYLEFPIAIPKKMQVLASFFVDRKFYYGLIFQHARNYGEGTQKDYRIFRFDYGGDDLNLEQTSGVFVNAIFSREPIFR